MISRHILTCQDMGYWCCSCDYCKESHYLGALRLGEFRICAQCAGNGKSRIASLDVEIAAYLRAWICQRL